MLLLKLIKMAAHITKFTGSRVSSRLLYTSVYGMTSEYGSGEGKGGGSGGAVRRAGGSFGKMEHAHEEQYFRKQQEAQLKSLKEQHQHMAEIHKKEIKHHEGQIERHKEALAQYEKMKKKMEAELKKDD